MYIIKTQCCTTCAGKLTIDNFIIIVIIIIIIPPPPPVKEIIILDINYLSVLND
jgi:hypothetical protein